MKRRILSALGALLFSSTIAFAVITGTWSEKQDEQAAIGQMQLGSGSATGNSVTINNGAGIITTASLTTAQSAVTPITLTNSRVAVGDMVQCTVDPGASAGVAFCANAAVTAGQVIFNVGNLAAAALNAPVKIYWWINKAGNSN